MMSDAEPDVVEVKPIAGIGTKVFGKWDASEVTCRDPGLAPYINLTTVGVPHTGGRHANAWFGKSKLSVVERYINKLMRTGAYTGKKMGAMKAFEGALDDIAERSATTRCKSLSMPSALPHPWRRSPVSSSVPSHNQRQWTPHPLVVLTSPSPTWPKVRNKARTSPSGRSKIASSTNCPRPVRVMSLPMPSARRKRLSASLHLPDDAGRCSQRLRFPWGQWMQHNMQTFILCWLMYNHDQTRVR